MLVSRAREGFLETGERQENRRKKIDAASDAVRTYDCKEGANTIADGVREWDLEIRDKIDPTAGITHPNGRRRREYTSANTVPKLVIGPRKTNDLICSGFYVHTDEAEITNVNSPGPK